MDKKIIKPIIDNGDKLNERLENILRDKIKQNPETFIDLIVKNMKIGSLGNKRAHFEPTPANRLLDEILNDLSKSINDYLPGDN